MEDWKGVGMPKGQRTDREVIDAIEGLAALGYGATDIVRKLENDERYVGRVPERRTVQNYVKKVAQQRDGAHWPGVRIGDDPQVCAAALAVLAYALELSDGRIQRLTYAEVQWVGQLSAIDPTLPPEILWHLSRQYQRRTDANDPTTDLDLFLAHHSWRSAADLEAYRVLLEQHGLSQPPFPVMIPTVAGVRRRLQRDLAH